MHKDDDGLEERITEHRTTTFEDLVCKRKDKVLAKDERIRSAGKSKKESKKEQKQMVPDNNSLPEVGNAKKEPMTITNMFTVAQVEKGVTNNAFKDDIGSLNEETKLDSSRIPVLQSTDYQGDDVTLEVDDEVKRPDPMVLKKSNKTESMGASPKIGKLRSEFDNKSLTAVCSFEVLGSESDTGDSEFDFDEKPVSDLRASSSRDNLISELAKINKSLPPIKNTSNSQPVSLTSSDKSEDQRKKKEKKHKVGKVLKDLTKTTKASNTPLPSHDDTRYIEASEKLKLKKRIKHRKELLDSSSVDEKKDNTDDDVENCKMTKNSSESDDSVPSTTKPDNNDIVQFEFDSASTDGEDVEVIYRSTSEHEAGTARSRTIDAVANANVVNMERGKISRIKQKEDTNGGGINMPGGNYSGSTDYIEENPLREIDRKAIHGQSNVKLVTASGVEHDIELSDMEEDKALTSPSKKPNVPPLRLNVGEQLGKKAKKINKHQSTNRKYLGFAAPPIPKKVL